MSQEIYKHRLFGTVFFWQDIQTSLDPQVPLLSFRFQGMGLPTWVLRPRLPKGCLGFIRVAVSQLTITDCSPAFLTCRRCTAGLAPQRAGVDGQGAG